MKTDELARHFRAHIATKYASNGKAPRFVLMHEVADSTGWGMTRKADAILLDCWKSKAGPQSLHGFEFKVSRADWLTELRNPGKADAIERFCHSWTVVAAVDVVKDKDFWASPQREQWGLCEVLPGGVVVIRQKAKPQDADPAPMRFVASLVRRAFEAGRDEGLARVADEVGE